MVLLVLSLLAGAALRYAAALTYASKLAETNAILDVVENALMNYRIANNRIPCPNYITLAENDSTFGYENSSSFGVCDHASFWNPLGSGNSTDPDAASPYAAGVTGDGNYGGSADPLYDSATVGTIVAGGIPNKVLQLADKYVYDAWGRKILYVMDARLAKANAFLTYSSSNTTIGGIVIKKKYNDPLSQAITYKAIYALVSFGAIGHGGYTRNLSSTASILNTGVTNTDTLTNCHCSSSGVAWTYWNRIFVQKAKTANSSTNTDSFDDIVRYKTRSEVLTTSELQ